MNKLIKKMTMLAAIPMAVVLFSSNTEPKCPPESSIYHWETILLPHADDCGLYWSCSYGVPMLQKCPTGLHFNPILNLCDWPQNVDCGGLLKSGYKETKTTTIHEEDGKLKAKTYSVTCKLGGNSPTCTPTLYTVFY